MNSSDFDAFKAIITDVCVAYDRTPTDDRVRVFWEDLKFLPMAEVIRGITDYRRRGHRMPVPRDLIPERRERPRAPMASSEPYVSTWGVAASRILFALAYSDPRRGCIPLGEALVAECVRVKNDIVAAAEEAEASGDKWDTVEFNIMCREAFEKLIPRGKPMLLAKEKARDMLGPSTMRQAADAVGHSEPAGSLAP